mgnify:CR=1 FL=1
MLRKFFVMATAMATTVAVCAQEAATVEEKKATTTISGFADVYYRYDFSKNPSNNRTSFTNSHNSFELGMASVRLDQTFGKVSMTADLGFGKRQQEFSYNESGIVAAIKQLFISYQATEWLKLTAGSWATHVGYEVEDAPVNRNYSMSYMFSYGPFFHTGIKADATFGKRVKLGHRLRKVAPDLVARVQFDLFDLSRRLGHRRLGAEDLRRGHVPLPLES